MIGDVFFDLEEELRAERDEVSHIADHAEAGNAMNEMAVSQSQAELWTCCCRSSTVRRPSCPAYFGALASTQLRRSISTSTPRRSTRRSSVWWRCASQMLPARALERTTRQCRP